MFQTADFVTEFTLLWLEFVQKALLGFDFNRSSTRFNPLSLLHFIAKVAFFLSTRLFEVIITEKV